MNLLKEFQEFIDQENLFEPDHKLLLALSGGIDSMVLLNLLLKLNYQVEAAHVNFCLRGEESNADALFLEEYCHNRNIQLHRINFDTNNLAANSKEGIQELARKLRYDWFKELKTNLSFDYILTAHHANDQAETILFHLLRGAGSKGLIGIRTKKDGLVRPLLFAQKEAILSYAKENNILYREDSSNQKESYTRNFIRHQIMPKALKVQPAFVQNSLKQGKLMEATWHYYQEQITLIKNEVCKITNEEIKINLQKILLKPYPQQLLFELISDFGFNEKQCSQIIISHENKHVGANFLSSNYKGVLNRNDLLIQEYKEEYFNLTIEFLPFEFNLNSIQYKLEETDFTGFEPNTWWLDLEKFTLPFTIRNIEKGDRFKPLGMNQNKKISDYLIDKKVDQFQKAKCLILASNKKLGMILPFQISNEFRVEPETKKHLKISLKKEG